MYLAWAVFYEGATDAAFLNVVIHRTLEDMLFSEGNRLFTVPETPSLQLGSQGRTVENVAREICENTSAFHLLFIHADTGGRALEQQLSARRNAYADEAFRRCGWNSERTIYVSPRHETEAWALADPDAVCRALGYNGNYAQIKIPESAQEAERLVDPKAILNEAAKRVSPRRFRNGATSILTTIAQEQSLPALRASPSFLEFEQHLRTALSSLGCLRR